MRMPLDQMARYWRGKEPEDVTNVVEFIATLRANLEVVRVIVYEKETIEKEKQKHNHDISAKDKAFFLGDFVLVLRPTLQNKLLNQWQGLYPITGIVTPITYLSRLRGNE